MSDRTQIGPDVDAELWHRFREDVKERHGKVRGVLGKELDTALRQHLGEDTRPAERRIEQRLIRIEDALETTKPDGGATVSDGQDTHTHRTGNIPADSVTERPDPKAARDKKVAYLAQCTLENVYADRSGEIPDDFESVTKSTLRDTIKDEYGFRHDTAKQYEADLCDYFDLVDHPDNDIVLVTRDKKQKLLQESADDQLREAEQ